MEEGAGEEEDEADPRAKSATFHFSEAKEKARTSFFHVGENRSILIGFSIPF